MAQLKDLIVSGATRILGKTYSPEFVGKLTGNADTATKATGDSSGSNIRTTYAARDGFRFLQDGNGVYLRAKNGAGQESGNFAIPAASASAWGVVTKAAQVFAGEKTFNDTVHLKADVYSDALSSGALNLNNSNIYGVNSIIMADLADSAAEGIQWYRDSTHADSIWVKNGVMYFTPNRPYGGTATDYTIMHSNNYTNYTVTKAGSGASGTWGINITGNAGSASKLTSNAGSNIQPIYFNNGVPVATSYSLNAKVNAGTAARLTYYSTSTNLAAAGRIGYWDSNNSKGATRTYLKIWGPTYGNTASTTMSGAAGVLNWDDGGPQIRFGTSETTSQDGALIYTDNDYSGTGASFHFVSTEGDVSVNSKRFVARTSVTIGQNLQNNSYNLYVNGNASIYKDLRIIGNESIDDSTRLIFHASDSTQRAIIAWNGNVDNGSQSSTHLKISSSYGAIKLKPGNGYLDFGNGSNDLHIQAHTKTFNQDIISAYDAPGGGYGIDLVIGAGATTIVGAGESAAAMRSVGASANENLYLTADANVFLYSNCDTIGNRRYVVFDTSRNFYPDTDSSGSIGVSNKRWNNGYFNYLNIRGSSSTDMTYSTTNPKIIFSDGNGAQAVGIVYTDTDVYRPTKGLKIMDVNNDDAGNVWFEVQGDIWTGGNIRINNNKGLIQSQSNTSNYTSAVLWYKNGVSQNTYNPQIGQHNTGGDGNGSICILPYATATEPWGGTVGLFITKSILKLDGKRISTTGNDSGTVGGNSRFIYSNAGTLTASTATIGNSTTPVYVNNGTFTAITSYSGNSATATRLQTSRTISLTGTVVGSGSFNGSANLSISTSVKDVNNSNTVTFAYSKAGVGYNDITWLAAWNGYELRAINKNQFAKASTSGNALYADDSDKLDGYHRKGLYPSIPDWINANGYTKTITVNGNANTYYPVVIGAPLNKEGLSYVSIWKNLGSKTASYSGNHSNGTSSMWIIYEGRNWYWDGNGGYAKCWYYSMPYANLCAQTDFLPNAVGSYCVYLRGGGTDYCISTTYDCTPKVYYSATNVGDSNYPVNIAPRTSIGNYGRVSSTVLGYGNIEGIATAATSLTSSAGSSTSPIYFSGGKPVACGGTLSVSITGNATTATALTSSAGSSTQPIYFFNGKPLACNSTLSVSITGNAATSTTTFAITTVANNEIRFTKPSTALAGNALCIGYAWADGSKSKMINEYKFYGGDGNLTAITASSITAASRIYANEWIQFDNYTGLYSPNNNAHFMPNDATTYGQWKILGSKGSYSGIHFGSDNSYMTVMDSGEHKGFYQESQGRWIFYYNRSTQCIGLGTSSLNTNYRVTIDGGALVSNVINSSYKSGSWVNSLTNSVITLSDATGSYGGWICGPTKNGRIAISTYQASDDKLYFGYGERGRTTNSFSNSMYWNGPTNTLSLGRVETSGEVVAASNVKAGDNFLANNGHGLYVSDTSGNYRCIIDFNASNLVVVGYGPHAAGIGGTVICGKEIIFQTPQNSWFRTYYKPGDSFTVHLTCGGFCTEYAKNLYFTIPIDRPMVGITSASIRSSQGLIIRQNNSYLYGSGVGKYIQPASYTAKVSGGTVWVYATFGNTTNATNNSACGCTVDVVVTFS